MAAHVRNETTNPLCEEPVADGVHVEATGVD